MLSDTDTKCRDADVEEGEIGEGSGAAAAKESGESLTGVKADPGYSKNLFHVSILDDPG
jgi:hypothetical protein